MSKAPDPPNPYTTAAAQTQSNKDTAGYNAALNRTNTVTPYGTSTYTQNGTDATGAPLYTNTINLTPQAQSQLDTQLNQNDAIAKLGLGLTDQIGNSINTPLPDTATDGKAAANAYYKNQTDYLDPQFANQQSDMDAKLANQGINQSSNPAAYQRAEDQFGRDKTFAYNQAQNTAIQQGVNQQQQAFQLASAIKNQPLNQLSALRSGTQIQNPTFTPAPSATAAGTDVAGIINTNYQQQVANANANNPMNGLFSLGSAAIMASDRRLKRNIRRLGETPVMKLPVYAYEYIWGGGERVGVMAQDVLRVKPDAVVTMPNGFYAVDYGAIG